MAEKKQCKNLSGFTPCEVSLELGQRLETMPKTEIHVHIEGATEPEVYWELAQRNKVSLPVKSLDEFKNFFVFRDFNHFIDVFIASVSALRTPEDYYTIVENFMKTQADQNIVWTQAFLSLSLLAPMSRKAFLQALKDALADGRRKYKVHLALIGDIARNIPETQDDVVQLVLDGFNEGVFIGLGLGGIETNFPPELFVESYRTAMRAGLKPFAHAGETTGPETIRNSVNLLCVTSIGHGIRILDDEQLVRRYAKSGNEKIVFEVCPQSNYATGLVLAGQPHPLRKMMESGLYCTVSSDDPAMFSSSLTNEYKLLAAQGFTWAELWELNLNSLSASAIPEAARSEIEKNFALFRH